jgi:hypothetical protein
MATFAASAVKPGVDNAPANSPTVDGLRTSTAQTLAIRYLAIKKDFEAAEKRLATAITSQDATRSRKILVAGSPG